MPPLVGRGGDREDEEVGNELEKQIKDLKALLKHTRVKDHEKDIGGLVTWLAEEGKRSRMTVARWEELGDEVLFYFHESSIKTLPCHLTLLEKILLHNGQPNKQLVPELVRDFLKRLSDTLHLHDSGEKILAPLTLPLKHEQLVYELLKHAEYRAGLTSKMLERYAELSLSRLEKETDAPSRARALHILENVFLEMRRDEGHVSKDLCSRIFHTLQSLGIGQDVLPFFRALTQCLLTFAPDHYDKAKVLCSNVHSMLKESWSSTGMDSKNRALVQYLLVFVRGQLATPDQMKECFDLLQSHICNVPHRPIDTIGHEKSDMTSESRDLFELFADLLHLQLEQIRHGEGLPRVGAGDQAQEAPAKRMKPTPALDLILGRMFTESNSLPNVNWLQFLCILSERYPADVSEAFCCSVLDKIKTVVTKKLDDTKCVWVCHALIGIDQLLRYAQPVELKESISMHWEAIFRHTVEQLKVRRLVKADMVTGVQLRMLTFALSGRQLSANVVAECLPQIWSMVSSAIRGDFFKMPWSTGAAGERRETAMAQRLVRVQNVFADFVGAVLRRNLLADSRNQECSRETLLLLIFDKVKEQGSGPVRQWFGSMASMIVSTVCSRMSEASAKEMSVEPHGFKAETNEHYMWRDLSGAGSDEDLFRLRLNMLEEHMASAGYLAVKSAPAASSLHAVERSSASSVLPRVSSIALQLKAWEHLCTLIEGAGDDGQVDTKSFVSLACEILRAAVRMDVAEECNENLLSKIAAVLLGDRMDDSAHALSLGQIWRESDPFARTNSSQDAMDSLRSHFDAILEYRDAVPDSFTGDDTVSALIKSVCKSCVAVLGEPELDAVQVDDEFDERPVSKAGRTQDLNLLRKVAALDLLLKLGHVQGDCFTASEAEAVESFASSQSRTLAEVSLILELMFRHPISLLNGVFVRLMNEISLGDFYTDEATEERDFIRLMHPQRRETVVPLAIALMAQSFCRNGISGARADDFLKCVRPKIAHYAKTLADYHKQSPEKQKNAAVIYPAEKDERKKKAYISRELRRTFFVCVGHLIPLSERNFLALVADGQEQGKVLKTMLQGLQDRAWDVRQTLAGLCPSFFKFTQPWKVYQPIVDEMQAVRDSASSTPVSVVRTRVRTLGNIIRLSEGIVDEGVESNALFMLCVLCKQFPAHEDMIVSVVSWAAKSRDFSGRLELFSAHMPSILRQWVNAGLAWSGFPFATTGYRTMVEFIRGVAAETLVPEFVIQKSMRDVEEMGKILDPAAYAKNKGYLKNHCEVALTVRIFHVLFANQCEIFRPDKVKKSQSLRVLISAVETYYDEHKMDADWIAMMENSIEDVLIAFLEKTVYGLSLEDGNELAAKFTETNLGRVILTEVFRTFAEWLGASLGSGATPSAGGLLLGLGQMNGLQGREDTCSDRLQNLTVHFMGVLKNTRRLKQKEKVVSAIEVMLDILGDSIFSEERAWAIQHIVWLLLVAMSDESILLRAAGVLNDKIVQVIVCKTDAAKKAESYRALAPVLLDIICSLYPYCTNPGFNKFNKLYREIVDNLIVNAPKELDKSIMKHLPPFPADDPFFRRVRERFDRTRNEEDAHGRTLHVNWTIEDDIQLFLEGSEHVHTEVQKVQLQHFASQLQAEGSRETLNKMHLREAASEHGEALTLCVRKLLQIVRRASPKSEIPNLAAQCLGHIGPVISRSLSVSVLRPPHLPVLQSKERYENGPAASKKQKAQLGRELVVTYDHIRVAIVQTLRMYLADRSFKVVSTASELLKNIFRQDWVYGLLVSSMDKIGALRIADGSALDRDANTWTHPYENAVEALRKKSDAGAASSSKDAILWMPGDTPYASWIARLAHHLCLDDATGDVWELCADMCLVKPEFAELIFPHLLFGTYMSRDKNTHKVFSMRLIALLSSENKCLPSVRLALNVIDFFRSFHQDAIQEYAGVGGGGGPSPKIYNEVKQWATRYWFDIPYNVTARASLRCDAPLTAILYMELDMELFRAEAAKKGFRRSNTFDIDNKMNHNEVLMLKAYRLVDEPDGIHAFNKMNDFHSHIITYEQEEEWGKSLGLFDTLLTSKSDSSLITNGLSAVTAMHMAGYNHLPLLASRSIPMISQETKCEALWRSGALDLADAETGLHERDDKAKGFNGYLLDALRALEKMVQNKGELDEVAISIEGARLVALQELTEHELQSIKESHPVLVRLQCCQDLTDVAHVLLKHSGRTSRIRSLVAQWGKRYKSMQNRFVLQEPSIALHGVLLAIVKSDSVQEQLCLTAKHALKQGNISYARSAMMKLKHRLSETGLMRKPDCWWLTEARVLWEDRRKDQAMRIMCDLEDHLRPSKKGAPFDGEDGKLLAKVLKINAEWLSVSRTERWAAIKEKMEEGLDLRRKNQMSCTNALFKLAAFLDGMHCQDDEDDPEEVKRKQTMIKNSIKELEVAIKASPSDKNLPEGAKDDKKHLSGKLKRYREELKILQEHEEHRQTFTLGAMENYLAHLQARGTQKRAVFRVLQIWFENSTLDQVNQLLCDKLEEIRSLPNNFTILVPQIVSRLDSDANSNPGFQRALRVFLSRLLEARPDDTIFPLFTAKNEARGRPTKGGLAGVIYAVNQDRVDAAKQLLDSMCTQGLDLGTPDGRAERERRETLLKQTEVLIEAYIELADSDISNQGRTGRVLPKMQRIKWTDEESLVRVPTSQSGSKVAGFDDSWSHPGGITMPKLITCKGTDGQRYKQIVKGKDDQRCDAVTSQLFEVMGMLLRQDVACCRRQLNIRTYKIIPLHPLAGVLEFVNATAFQSILGDTKSKDSPKTLRDRIREGSKWQKYSNHYILEELKKWDFNSRQRMECFKGIMKETEPVFHHYFLDKSWSAPTWFQRRLAFTRSVASTSMAGFIVGLGDRHTSNTLLIEDSSEILNIDLGIVFDQGRLLSVPELVPFRLTREVVDAFGVAETGGVFTRCCEETLRVLRDNKEDLLAIVDVLLHDPLMSWKMSTVKKNADRRRQGGESDATSAMGSVQSESAERLEERLKTADAKMVRKQVKDKLEGRHRSEHLGVEGQVKQLILDASSQLHESELFNSGA